MNAAVRTLIAACAILVTAHATSRAADPDVQAAYDNFVKPEMPGVSIDLLQAAKKEGAVTLHRTVLLFNNHLIDKFNATFPFVHANMLQMTGGPLVTKFMAESRAKTPGADVVQVSSLADAKAADAEGFIMPYTPAPESEFVMSQGVPGRIFPMAGDLMTIAYNPTRISDADAMSLRTWSGLLDPKWSKMQYAFADVGAGGSTQVLNYYFQTHFGDKLWRMMAMSGGYSIFPGGAPEVAAVISGASDIAVGPNVGLAVPQFLKGAPVHWTNPEDWLQIPHDQFVSAQARHPNAARLLQEFMAARFAQATVLVDGSSTYRRNMQDTGPWTREPWYHKVDTSKVWDYSFDKIGAAMPDITRQWRAIFK